MDPVSAGARGDDPLLFHQPSRVGLAVPGHDTPHSPGSRVLADLRSVLALAGCGGGLADRARAVEGPAALCTGRGSSLFVISRFQPAVGSLSLQPFFHCPVLLSGFHLPDAQTPDSTGPALFRTQPVDDGIFLPIGICTHRISMDRAAWRVSRPAPADQAGPQIVDPLSGRFRPSRFVPPVHLQQPDL